MPIGRFRKDPRTLDEVELEVSARQIPEAALNVGLGLGLSVGFLASLPGLVTAALPIVGGIVGYLAGYRLKTYRIEQLRDRATSD